MRKTMFDMSPLLVITLVAAASLSWSPAMAADSSHNTSMQQLLKKAKTDADLRDTVRIEIEGNLDKNLRQLTIYGRGLGIWNGEGQFTLKSKEVVAATDLLLKEKFYEMPERFAYDENDHDLEMPVKLIRVVTVTVAGQSKTVIQDNKGPKSEAFAKLTADLVSVCRKPAHTLVTATSLKDGLEKIVNGTLAPETLTVSVNAPELRSLQSQEGQGWQLSIQHASLTLTSVTIEHGVTTVVERALDEAEIKKVAREFLQDGVTELPSTINTKGYTQLTVGVLNQKVRTMARTFATEPDQDAKEAAASFASVRRMLYAMYKKDVKARAAD